MVLDLIKWLGIPGALLLVGATFVVPSLLPGVVVRTVTAAVDAFMTAVGYVLGKIAAGAQHIAGSDAAVFTLVFGIIAGGIIGDRYDPFRSRLPIWLQGEPYKPPVPAPVAEVADVAPAAQKPATARRRARAPELETDPMGYLRCQLGGGC